jgi:hypothetical protein
LTLYRLTPVDAGGLLNMDSGDAAGDVEFSLSRKDIAAVCANSPGDERCFLAHQNVYGRFTVEVDGQYGPYSFCNPTMGSDGKPNVSAFSCCSSFDDDAPGVCNAPTEASSFSPYSTACACPRGNVSVGKVNHAEMSAGFHNGTSFVTTLQGYWYSTPGNGECTGDARPGMGKRGECTWKLVSAVYKNTSCVDNRLDTEVERRGNACFAACPPRGSTGYADCWYNCYIQTVNGNATVSPPIPAMTRAELIEPWASALASTDPNEGGCPTCHGRPPFRPGDCP